ncbi:MAG TPA: TAXI family TRAP transporter solute-binding subunit [Candidatus Baltobacteraceae bacterium]|nr:TAXI family TRAP transporter solute-binding subunit [Candidatus Baltobacteraceae bacterium]
MRRNTALALLLVGLSTCVCLVLPHPAWSGELRIMTGPQGGAWYPLGGAIAEILKKEIPGTSASVLPGAGIINVQGVESGRTDIGFGNSVSTVDGVAGRDPFKAPAKNVRQLATLYMQYFQLIVLDDGKIKSVPDLKGKALAVQPRGNTGEQMTRELLQVYGMSYKDMGKISFVSYNDAVSLMKDGHVQVYSLISTVPAASVLDLASDRKIRILSVPEDKYKELVKINTGYARREIAKGTYPGIDYPVEAFGTFAHMMIRADLPDDYVYQITKAIAKHAAELGDVVKDVKGLNTKEMSLDVGVPYHPGALKFYKEAGVIK